MGSKGEVGASLKVTMIEQGQFQARRMSGAKYYGGRGEKDEKLMDLKAIREALPDVEPNVSVVDISTDDEDLKMVSLSEIIKEKTKVDSAMGIEKAPHECR